jgi:hypothetical protein
MSDMLLLFELLEKLMESLFAAQRIEISIPLK